MDEKINASNFKFPKMIKVAFNLLQGRRTPLHTEKVSSVTSFHLTIQNASFSNDFLRGCLSGSYSQVLVDYPLAVLVGCAALLLGCSLAGLFIGPLPDFSDPLLVGHKQSCAY